MDIGSDGNRAAVRWTLDNMATLSKILPLQVELRNVG